MDISAAPLPARGLSLELFIDLFWSSPNLGPTLSALAPAGGQLSTLRLVWASELHPDLVSQLAIAAPVRVR